MKLLLVSVSVVLGLSMVLGGCAVERDQSTMGEYVDDAVITTRVKAKLAEDPGVSAMAVSVETLRGVVQLSGFAKSAAESQRAETLARQTPGVRSVRNSLVLRAAN